MTADAPIDFEKEVEEIMVHLYGKGHTMFHTKNVILGFGKLTAARVEAQTIERILGHDVRDASPLRPEVRQRGGEAVKAEQAIHEKNAALTKAIFLIDSLGECSKESCDDTYHWRGCPKTLKPEIDKLKEARDL